MVPGAGPAGKGGGRGWGRLPRRLFGDPRCDDFFAIGKCRPTFLDCRVKPSRPAFAGASGSEEKAEMREQEEEGERGRGGGCVWG